MMADWTWELLAGPGTTTGGLAWDGEGLFFSSIEHNEIRRFVPETSTITTVYRDTNGANGLYFAPWDGTLYVCESDRGRVVHYNDLGVRGVAAAKFEGKRFNGPNDLILDSQGRIWFTDHLHVDRASHPHDHESVYRLSQPYLGPTLMTVERLTYDTTRPNGLLLAPDERTLYLAQGNCEGTRELRAYPVRDDGALDSHSVLHDFGDDRGIDGICLDTDGNIIAPCGWQRYSPGPRIAVFTLDGTLLEEHPLPEGTPTKCVFGGADLGDLYVTTLEGHFYRVVDSGFRGAIKPPRMRPFIG